MVRRKNEKISLRGYKKGDEEQISHLFFNNFPDTLGPEDICKTWLWQFQNQFSKKSGVSVAELSDEIVAHYGVMWLTMCCQGKRIKGAISTATVTDAKVRGKGLFTKLAQKVFSETEKDGCKIIFGFPNSQSIRGFIKYLEWFEIAKFPLLIKPVNFLPFLEKFVDNKFLNVFSAFFLNHIYRFCFNLAGDEAQRKSIKLLTDVQRFPEEISEIWQTHFASKKIAIIRDLSYLKWRYQYKPFSDYDIVTAMDEDNQIVGVMVTTMAEKKGLKVVYIMEMLARDDDKMVYKTFLKYLDLYAKEKRADALSMLCLANHPNKWLFYRHGFLPVPRKMFPQDIHFCARTNSGDLDRAFLKNAENWFITWGDLDIV